MITKVLWATLIILSLLLLPTLVGAQPPIQSSTNSSGEGGWAESWSPSLPASTLWNQSSAGIFAVVDQYFPDVGVGVFGADDFTNADPWNIESIFVDGSGPGELTQADSLHWLIYPDAGGKPAGYPGDGSGTELWSHTCLPTDPEVTISGANDQVSLDVVNAQGAPLYLPPEIYWLAFYPTLDGSQYGQWYWDVAGTSNLAAAQLIDPTDLFGEGWTSWTPWTTAFDPTFHDAAFRLEGDKVTPTPVGGEAYPVNKLAILAPWIALAVLSVGAITWFTLRRRRA